MSKSLEERMKLHEKRYGLFTKKLVDAVWVLNLETMKYDYVSDTIERLLGYNAQDFQSFSLKELLTPKSYNKTVACLLDGINRFEKGEEVGHKLELEMIHKDRSLVWVETSTRFYKETDGSIKTIGISKDITERKRFEEKREELIRQLEESLEEQRRLQRENKVLRGLLPICAECKRIRDDKGKWWPVEEYIASRTEADFTHTICPICKDKLYPELKKVRNI